MATVITSCIYRHDLEGVVFVVEKPSISSRMISSYVRNGANMYIEITYRMYRRNNHFVNIYADIYIYIYTSAGSHPQKLSFNIFHFR